MATLRQPEAILAVIKFADGWRILPGGSKLAPYPSQEAAVAVARHLVELAQLSGREVRLLIQHRFGELCDAPSKPVEPRRVERDEARRTVDLKPSDRPLPSQVNGAPLFVNRAHPGGAEAARL